MDVQALNAFGNWLYDWQTLITGLLALVVGSGTILMIKKQLDHQDKVFLSSRESRFSVAKAKVPVAAVYLADHAKVYLREIEKLWPLVQGRSHEPFNFDGPQFPKEAEVIFDSLVENSSDSTLIEQISALYSEQQVLNSRLCRVGNPSQHSLTICDYVLQPLMMDAIAMNLLAFGRDGAEVKRLSWSDVRSSAKRLISSREIQDVIVAYIDGKDERGVKVPLALRRHE